MANSERPWRTRGRRCICELLVGLPAVTVLGIDDLAEVASCPHRDATRRSGMPRAAGVSAQVHDRPIVESP